jgi:hypothetical protein
MSFDVAFRNAAVSVELALSPIEREIIAGRARVDLPPAADGQPVCVLLGLALDSVGALCRVEPIYADNPGFVEDWAEAAVNWLPQKESLEAWRSVVVLTASYLDRWQPDVEKIVGLAARVAHDGFPLLDSEAGRARLAAFDAQRAA